MMEIHSSWNAVLSGELSAPYMAELEAFLEKERSQNDNIYPPKELVFNALCRTSFENTKVVIVGQDPYHGPGQAHGLSFSVPKGTKLPPSLKNIFKELQNDLGIPLPEHGCLESWADQGVLLLNATLTVRESNPMSHHGKGWERFTDAVIAKLCEREDPVIFVLWGKSAQEKCHQIEQFEQCNRHEVLIAPHPSPFSARRGFFGCHHFSKINTLLTKMGKTPIEWQLARSLTDSTI